MTSCSNITRCLPGLLLALGTVGPLAAQTVGDCAPAQAEAYLDVGNVRARIFNNGNLFWRGAPNVYEVPKGSGVNPIFAAGLWIGGLTQDTVRMAGSSYGPYEFWAGPLTPDGQPRPTAPPTTASSRSPLKTLRATTRPAR
jgi:hypothetical protein